MDRAEVRRGGFAWGREGGRRSRLLSRAGTRTGAWRMFSFSSAARAEPEAPAGEVGTKSAFAFDPLELLGRVRRRPGLVAGSGAVAVLLAVVALAFIPPSFTAGTQILIDPSDL